MTNECGPYQSKQGLGYEELGMGEAGCWWTHKRIAEAY